MERRTGDRAQALRDEMQREADAGFPLLSRIPATDVIRFLDYVDDLDPGRRAVLLDQLATRASNMIAAFES